MYNYRVTKYNPEYRVNGAYLKDEWTAISDIGKVFEGKLFTEAEYMKAEKEHIEFIKEVCEQCDEKELKICNLEQHGSNSWKDQEWVTLVELDKLISDCLREECWCKLRGKNLHIHFGYDYYMYVSCRLAYKKMCDIALKYHLYAERFKSPYF